GDDCGVGKAIAVEIAEFHGGGVAGEVERLGHAGAVIDGEAGAPGVAQAHQDVRGGLVGIEVVDGQRRDGAFDGNRGADLPLAVVIAGEDLDRRASGGGNRNLRAAFAGKVAGGEEVGADGGRDDLGVAVERRREAVGRDIYAIFDRFWAKNVDISAKNSQNSGILSVIT